MTYSIKSSNNIPNSRKHLVRKCSILANHIYKQHLETENEIRTIIGNDFRLTQFRTNTTTTTDFTDEKTFVHVANIDYSNHHEAALMACGGGGDGGS